MDRLDIIVPVRNEEKNIRPLVGRIDAALSNSNISYNLIFIDDKSDDKTVSVLKRLQSRYSIKVYSKIGKQGKAYSILEGAKYSTSDNLAMLDGDLQYPPEAIPEMFKLLQDNGVVIASRKTYGVPFIRKALSKSFRFIFGTLLFKLNVDVQSGLKLFKKEIIGYLKEEDVTPWTIDLPLLFTAKELGYKISEVKVDFSPRNAGSSNISLISSILEIGKRAIGLRLRKRKVYPIFASTLKNMKDSGIIYKGKRFITYSTLDYKTTAFKTFNFWQQIALYTVVSAFLSGLVTNFFFTLSLTLAILSLIYFVDVLFNLYLILKSLHFPPEIHISEVDLKNLKDSDLPTYSILCPLYREVRVILHFMQSLERLDYPKEKLDVQLLLEEDDTQTIDTVKNLNLPNYVRVNIVPNTQPKTKPKACNFGLNEAKGEYLVIYDAEDEPEPLQLKKAFLAFQKVKDDVVCLQAKLNYYNPHQNLLTRFFTAEYSLWFDVILPGLQTIQTNIPLGGTSNHFKTKTLISLKGWDPFNVTEDCDLGIRLFTHGKKTAIINSTTLEEANSNFKNWLRQRSRWIKGYMQTFLVHTRNPYKLFKQQGIHALVFQLTIGGKIAFLFINPILWAATIAYFAFYSIFGSAIESLYSPTVFYMAVFSAVFGNFLYLYYYMIGCARRGYYSVIKYVFFVPIYWLMGSTAAFIALYQLIFKPHYWEKTHHGLNLQKEEQISEQTISNIATLQPEILKGLGYINQLKIRVTSLLKIRQTLFKERIFVGGSLLIAANMIANLSNFVFNAFLGRVLTLEQFGELSLFTSLLFLSSIPINALSATTTQKCAYLFGKFSKGHAKSYLKRITSNYLISALILTFFWLLFIPFLREFFNSESYLPFMIFTPIWLIAILSANFGGYLKGTLSFGKIASIVAIESALKLLIAVSLVKLGLSQIIYLAIPISLLVTLILGMLYASKDTAEDVEEKEGRFNFKFFSSAILLGFTNIAFLGLDVVLVKHFLSQTETGQYGLLALVGKMIFFFGSLLVTFILPIIAKKHGAKERTDQPFSILFGITIFFTLFASLSLAIFGPTLLPFVFGGKVLSILPYLNIYVITIALFTIAQPIVFYFQAKENYYFVLVSFFVSLLQIVLLTIIHANLLAVVAVMYAISVINLSSMGILYLFRKKLWIVTNAVRDLLDLISSPFSNEKYRKLQGSKENYLRILIYNWRDIKHKWSGGAEVYIHEMAKRWVKDGHQVTIFCGNDSECPSHESLDGIHIVRRGGFYMVYIWAALYYLIRFRGLYDVIIDSENGIPFFTPFYCKKPKFLLIHHIHQDVFREHLIKPLAAFATFLETKIMPFAYKNVKIVTVSESSKDEILKIAPNSFKSIDIINPGVDLDLFRRGERIKVPSFLYLGRLKSYKNIDIAIKAFAKVSKKYPKAKLTIAGFGESLNSLKKLVELLKIKRKVSFLGRVSDEEKYKLLATHWVFLQPSMIEGWGITVIEANASGTPVIASNVGGLKDSVLHGKTGMLVKAKSVEELAKAMARIISDKKLRDELSQNAYEWAQKYNWENSKEKLLKLIESEREANKKFELSLIKDKAIAQD